VHVTGSNLFVAGVTGPRHLPDDTLSSRTRRGPAPRRMVRPSIAPGRVQTSAGGNVDNETPVFPANVRDRWLDSFSPRLDGSDNQRDDRPDPRGRIVLRWAENPGTTADAPTRSHPWCASAFTTSRSSWHERGRPARLEGEPGKSRSRSALYHFAYGRMREFRLLRPPTVRPQIRVTRDRRSLGVAQHHHAASNRLPALLGALILSGGGASTNMDALCCLERLPSPLMRER